MHHALTLPEILRMICDEINPFNSTDSPEHQEIKAKNQDALTRIARVCRAFKDPALDALWTDVDRLDYLICLLPSDRLIRDELNNITDLRSPSPDELENLYQHSRRIRKLTVGISADLGKFAAGELLRLADAASIFPRLRHLVVQDARLWSIYSYSLHRNLLLPWLTTVELYIHPDRSDCDTLPVVLPDACPGLQNLVVGFPESTKGNTSITKAIAECVFRLPGLLSLSCPDLEDEAFYYAFQLSRIRELKLTDWMGMRSMMGSKVSHSKEEHSQNNALQPPSKLALRLDRLSDATNLMPTLTTFPSSLELDVRVTPEPEEIAHLFGALAAHPSGSRLQRLVLKHEDEPFWLVFEPESVQLKLTHFRPAFRLHSMRSLRFYSSDPPISLTSDCLLELAHAWPFLEEFYIPHMQTEPSLSLDDVLAFAEACPRLTELAIPITYEPIDFGDTTSELRVRNRALKTLRIYHLHHGDLPRVSVVLARAFPNLSLVEAEVSSNIGTFLSELGNALMVAIRKLRAEEERGKIKKWTVRFLARKVEEIFLQWRYD